MRPSSAPASDPVRAVPPESAPPCSPAGVLPNRSRHELSRERLADRRRWLALVASDREWSARALEATLAGAGYGTLRVESADQAVAVCGATSPDLVFVDCRLGDGGWGRESGERGGVALCARLRREGVVSEAVPIILITADAVRRADVLDALKAGAWDLCTLPGDSVGLLARCVVWVRAKRHADRAAESALVDPETGAYNLQGLIRRAREAAAASRREAIRGPLACIAFRVERLEDTPGDAAGAWEIPVVTTPATGLSRTPGVDARRVLDACLAGGRATDVVGRVGLREFVILAPATSADGAARLLARLRERLATTDRLLGAEEPRAGRGVGGTVAGAMLVRATTALTNETHISDEEATDVVVRAVWALDVGG